MVNQVALVLILLTAFFAFYYKFVFFVSRIIGRRVCAVCFSVGSTWLSLLVLDYSGIFMTDHVLIGLLLSESVVGISYLAEEFIMARQVKVPAPLLKIGIIVYGTLAVTVFAFGPELLGLLLFVPVVVFGFLALTPNPKVERPITEESLELELKLKTCC